MPLNWTWNFLRCATNERRSTAGCANARVMYLRARGAPYRFRRIVYPIATWLYTYVCCNIVERRRKVERNRKAEKIQGRKIQRNYIVEDCQMGGSDRCSEDHGYNSVSRLCSYRDNSILSMILVAITSKLPWSGLFLTRTAWASERANERAHLKAPQRAAKRKAILLLITEQLLQDSSIMQIIRAILRKLASSMIIISFSVTNDRFSVARCIDSSIVYRKMCPRTECACVLLAIVMQW